MGVSSGRRIDDQAAINVDLVFICFTPEFRDASRRPDPAGRVL